MYYLKNLDTIMHKPKTDNIKVNHTMAHLRTKNNHK